MTRFDSIHYRPLHEFHPLKQIREEYIEWREEHEEKFNEIAPDAQVRYSICIQETWWEERFSELDSEELVLYHDLPIEEEGQRYLQRVCVHYGYLYGFRWPNQTTDDECRNKTMQALIEDEHFIYDNKMVLYQSSRSTLPIGICVLEEGNVLLEVRGALENQELEGLKKKIAILLHFA